MKLALYTVLFLVCNFVAGQTTYFNNRYDHNGNLEVIWSVLETDSGYLCATGTGKVLLYYLNKNGNVVWLKEHGDPSKYYYAGGSSSLIPTQEGGYALGGSVDIGNGQGVLWRFNSNGDTIFTKYFGDSTQYFEAFYQCKQTPDSGFILIGATDKPSSGGNTDIWLVKTDKDGNFEWEKTYGGGGEEYGFGVIVSNDSGYLLSGYTNSFGAGGYDGYIIKVNDTGIVQWSQTYGDTNDNGGFHVSKTSDGGYICSGALYQYTLSASYDQTKAYLMKIDSTGNIEWDRAYGPTRYANGGGEVHELPDGSFVTAGQSNNNKGTPNGNGWAIGFGLKVSDQGDSIWYREFEYDSCEKNDDYVRDMKPTNDGGFIVAGFFVPRPADPCFDTGTQDMWVLKLDSCGCPYPNCVLACSVDTTGMEEFQISDFRFQIYPNPTEGKFIIEMFDNSEAEKPYQVSIYDILGREIKHIKSKSQKIEVDISGYGKGMYFIQVGNKNGFYYTRIVKH